MKQIKKLTAGFLAALLILSLLPFSVFAAPENTPKEEVVYINLNADGSVKEITVVNIFDLDEDGKIIDYGAYQSLRNMTTTDGIGYADETVTIDAKAGKLYYEGKLDGNIIPWKISIRYYMDGNEYSAEEIAGKSGELKITMQIAENPDCIGNFFEGYALQVSITLDTKLCKNIEADGATVANVGRNKQLTYTILPGKGANIEVRATVTDFEMSRIAINGLKMNLDIELDDAEIRSKISEITDAVQALDDGATELCDGVRVLYDGTTLLDDKVGELYDGVGALSSGSADLSEGLSAITAQNQALLEGANAAFEGLCAASSTILNAELSENGLPTVTLTPATYSAVLSELLQTLDADRVSQLAYDQALAEVTAQVEAQADAIYAGYVEQNANALYLAYVQSRTDDLYAQVAAQAILEQLVANGYTQEEAIAYLQTPEGQMLIAQTVSTMTDQQKAQIVESAVANLTDEQKAQIKAGALLSLTDEQKTQIRNGYIEETMRSEAVTDQIDAAVATANIACASIAELKGQLDDYSLFCAGMEAYTAAVGDAANGADTLKTNMNTLYTNVGTLKASVGELTDGVKGLSDGIGQLKAGTGAFVERTDGIGAQVSAEIDSMIATITGNNVAITSFVSEKNVNVDAVQFVMQTDAIEVAQVENAQPMAEEKLSFWQKLLRLFGLY
ncbi:MAG: hypothetical protein ACI3YH_03390 [Eubacteriales bacterium]